MDQFCKIVIIGITAIILQAGVYASDGGSPFRQAPSLPEGPGVPEVKKQVKPSQKPQKKIKPQKVKTPEIAPKASEKELPKTIEQYEKSVLKQAEKPETKPAQPPPAVSKPKPQKSGFIDALFNMFKILFKVIVLILVLAGIVLLYKKLKAGKAGKKRPPEEIYREPQSVQEAVSSFVRHSRHR